MVIVLNFDAAVVDCVMLVCIYLYVRTTENWVLHWSYIHQWYNLLVKADST